MYIGDAYIDPEAGLVRSRSGETVLEPKVMAVLVTLAQHKGEVVTRQELIDRVWGTQYSGDESLTRAISLLRKAFGGSHGVGSVIETIPKRGYRLLASVSATNPFEPTDTDTGHDSTRPVIPDHGDSRRFRLSVAPTFLLLAIAVLLASTYLFSILRNPASEADRSVTVLPFVALSSGEDDSYFADGLSEELLVALESLPELKLVAWSASINYPDGETRLSELARILNVAHIVEGTIRRDGDDVRITVRLTRVKDGAQLWSQAYDRPLEKVLEVQSEIAEEIAEALDVVLDERKIASMNAAGIRNVAAYITFQKAEALQSKAHGELPQLPTLIEANRLYDEVTDSVPGYFPAHFVKTDLYTHILLNAAAGEIEPQFTDVYISAAADEFHRIVAEAYSKARNDLERAYVGYVKTLFSDEWTDAGDYLDSLFELTSCGRNEQWAQILSIPFGRANQALDFFNDIAICDPLSTIPWINAAMASLYLGDPVQALSITDTAIEKVGFTPMLERTRFQALLAAEQLEEAQRSLQNLSGRAHMIGQVGLYAALGDREAATALVKVLYEQSDQVVSGELPGPLGNKADALIVSIAPMIGDHAGANAAAARIDARPYGQARLAVAVYYCLCGAPFDIEVTPKFKAQVTEAGFPWPPASPIDYPLKDW